MTVPVSRKVLPQFAIIVRTYVPTKPILDGAYMLPNVERR
jgi:hypothetical protein